MIIDDASELDQGQDALLKTLEEPPEHAVLLLLTTTPAALHETILSRLRPLQFRLVPTAEIADALRARGVRDADRSAAASGGRPGLAITLAGTEAVRADRARLEAELYRLFASGLTDRFAWAADLSDESEPRKRTDAIDLRLGHWEELLRDAAVAARGEVRPLRPERAKETEALAATLQPADLLEAALLAQRMRDDVTRHNANARALLELFALRLPFSAQAATKLEALGHRAPGAAK